MEKYEEIENLITGSKEDFKKFYEKGNQAAGTRARQALQKLKILAQEARVEIQDIKNGKAS